MLLYLQEEQELQQKVIKMDDLLYIEDNVDTAEAVKVILQREGFVIDLANTGREGLNKVRNKRYDIILLDIMLPDMSGWDVFQKLQKDKIKAKCVFLSVIPISTERMAELKKAGVCDYITKPFKKDDLISRLKKVLQS
jgi:two-component system, OmpR family, response regulator VicR